MTNSNPIPLFLIFLVITVSILGYLAYDNYSQINSPQYKHGYDRGYNAGSMYNDSLYNTFHQMALDRTLQYQNSSNYINGYMNGYDDGACDKMYNDKKHKVYYNGTIPTNNISQT